jgi:hypothetical protein
VEGCQGGAYFLSTIFEFTTIKPLLSLSRCVSVDDAEAYGEQYWSKLLDAAVAPPPPSPSPVAAASFFKDPSPPSDAAAAAAAAAIAGPSVADLAISPLIA